MAVYQDNAAGITNSIGTNSYLVTGSIAQYGPIIGVLTNGAVYPYYITFVDVASGTDYETGQGTWDSATNILVRTAIETSSNGNAAVNWGAGTKALWITQDALLATDMQNMVEGSTKKIMTVAERSNIVASKTKTDLITVTTPANLDTMQASIASFSSGMTYRGNWDASTTVFPGAGIGNNGDYWYCSVSGVVSTISFDAGDSIVALVNNPSISTFAGNWSKHDSFDAVQSVAGLVGAITAPALKTALAITGGEVAFTPTGGISATTVQSAVEEVNSVKEPKLNNPGVNGYVLSSTTGGTRSWIAPSTATLASLGLDANLTSFTLPASSTITPFTKTLLATSLQGAFQSTLGLSGGLNNLGAADPTLILSFGDSNMQGQATATSGQLPVANPNVYVRMMSTTGSTWVHADVAWVNNVNMEAASRDTQRTSCVTLFSGFAPGLPLGFQSSPAMIAADKIQRKMGGKVYLYNVSMGLTTALQFAPAAGLVVALGGTNSGLAAAITAMNAAEGSSIAAPAVILSSLGANDIANVQYPSGSGPGAADGATFFTNWKAIYDQLKTSGYVGDYTQYYHMESSVGGTGTASAIYNSGWTGYNLMTAYMTGNGALLPSAGIPVQGDDLHYTVAGYLSWGDRIRDAVIRGTSVTTPTRKNTYLEKLKPILGGDLDANGFTYKGKAFLSTLAAGATPLYTFDTTNAVVGFPSYNQQAYDFKEAGVSRLQILGDGVVRVGNAANPIAVFGYLGFTQMLTPMLWGPLATHTSQVASTGSAVAYAYNTGALTSGDSISTLSNNGALKFTFGQQGNFTAAGSLTAASLALSGAATVGTTLGVTGAATLLSTLSVAGNYTSSLGSITLSAGDISVASGRFVQAGSLVSLGNISLAGTHVATQTAYTSGIGHIFDTGGGTNYSGTARLSAFRNNTVEKSSIGFDGAYTGLDTGSSFGIVKLRPLPANTSESFDFGTFLNGGYTDYRPQDPTSSAAVWNFRSFKTHLSATAFRFTTNTTMTSGNIFEFSNGGVKASVAWDGMTKVTGLAPSVRTVAGTSDTITSADNVVAYTSTSAVSTTLPSAVTYPGVILTIKKMGTGVNTITINTVSSQTMDGSATARTITVQYNLLTLQSDGANWVVLKTGVP